MEKNLVRNLQIESLRAFAIGFVLLSHFWISSRDWVFDLYANAGWWVGVDLFFVVSGYLMTQQLQTRLARRQDGRVWPELQGFWLRRAFRLFPAAWLWLALPLLLLAWLPDHPLINIKLLANDALAAFLHLYNLYLPHCFQGDLLGTRCSHLNVYHPYWSLSLEEQFYLVLPLLLLGFSRRWLILLLGCVLIGLLFWVRGLFTYQWHLRVDGLLWGVLLALLGAQVLSPISRMLTKLRVGAVLSLGLLVLMLWQASLGYGVTVGYGISTIGVAALCSACLVWLALNGNGITPRWGMQWVGSRSYALYLVHYPMYYLCQFLIIPENVGLPLDISNPRVVLYILTALCTSGVAAEVTYRFVESPVREYGRKVAARFSQERPAHSSEVRSQMSLIQA